MSVKGIYYSEYYWPRFNTLWAYRFFADRTVLFTYADPVGRFVLHPDSGPMICNPKEILGDKSRLKEFESCFIPGSGSQISYRSGLPAIVQSRYAVNGTTICFWHSHFNRAVCDLTGHLLPDRMILTLTGYGTSLTGEKKSLTHAPVDFLLLRP